MWSFTSCQKSSTHVLTRRQYELKAAYFLRFNVFSNLELNEIQSEYSCKNIEINQSLAHLIEVNEALG